MKLMNCPLNGWRNIGEFVYGGEVTPMPAIDAATEVWADWVFMVDYKADVVREWWLHSPTNYWFIAERDTVNDQVIRTYPADEVFAQRVEFASGESPS